MGWAPVNGQCWVRDMPRRPADLHYGESFKCMGGGGDASSKDSGFTVMSEDNWPALCDHIEATALDRAGLCSWKKVSDPWAQAHCVSCGSFFLLGSEKLRWWF